MNYYNDNDPKVCAWARELIKAGLVPNGEVDCRSIADIHPSDLKGFVQHHFFCGILGWSYALRIAGWPEDRPVATASCPCQPLSSAGSRQGEADERHLWPAFFHLIAECGFPVVFGEQVASPDGREWFCSVRADLETLGYAVGGADLCAAGVGAPHERQRIYWTAAHPGSARGKGLVAMSNPRPSGPWGLRGAEDLLAIANAPFEPSDRWPQPLLRAVDDGLSCRVDGNHAAGNAIVPQLAAEFITASVEAMNAQP